jgi:hypothetical protein
MELSLAREVFSEAAELANNAQATRAARKERVLLIGTDQRITSSARSHNGCIQRPNACQHPNVSRKRQILFPCTVGAVHTWHYPVLRQYARMSAAGGS